MAKLAATSIQPKNKFKKCNWFRFRSTRKKFQVHRRFQIIIFQKWQFELVWWFYDSFFCLNSSHAVLCCYPCFSNKLEECHFQRFQPTSCVKIVKYIFFSCKKLLTTVNNANRQNHSLPTHYITHLQNIKKYLEKRITPNFLVLSYVDEI